MAGGLPMCLQVLSEKRFSMRHSSIKILARYAPKELFTGLNNPAKSSVLQARYRSMRPFKN
jgi:hypothetical protein